MEHSEHHESDFPYGIRNAPLCVLRLVIRQCLYSDSVKLPTSSVNINYYPSGPWYQWFIGHSASKVPSYYLHVTGYIRRLFGGYDYSNLLHLGTAWIINHFSGAKMPPQHSKDVSNSFSIRLGPRKLEQ